MRYPVAVSASLAVLLAAVAIGQERSPITFSLTRMGEIEDTAGTTAGFHTSYFRTVHLGFHDYEASNGDKVAITNGKFASAEEARRYFDWMLENRAAENLRQSDKLDRDGRIVGRRAEYSLKAKGTKEDIWIVMWTNEEHFHLINAPGIASALALEKLCGN